MTQSTDVITHEHKHELLHTLYIIQEMFAKFVSEHPASLSTNKIRRKIEKLEDDLASVYQLIGDEVFSGDDDARKHM